MGSTGSTDEACEKSGELLKAEPTDVVIEAAAELLKAEPTAEVIEATAGLQKAEPTEEIQAAVVNLILEGDPDLVDYQDMVASKLPFDVLERAYRSAKRSSTR